MKLATLFRRRDRLMTLLLCLALTTVLNVVFEWSRVTRDISASSSPETYTLTSRLGPGLSMSSERTYTQGDSQNSSNSQKLAEKYPGLAVPGEEREENGLDSDFAAVLEELQLLPQKRGTSENRAGDSLENDSRKRTVSPPKQTRNDTDKSTRVSASREARYEAGSKTSVESHEQESVIERLRLMQKAVETTQIPTVRAERSLDLDTVAEKTALKMRTTGEVRSAVLQNGTTYGELSTDVWKKTGSEHKERVLETKSSLSADEMAVRGRKVEKGTQGISSDSRTTLDGSQKMNITVEGIKRLVEHKIQHNTPQYYSTKGDNTESMSSKTSSLREGYLISVDYDQQMMGFFRAFYHLALFATTFNLSIVEPHIYGNGRYGIPLLRDDRGPTFTRLTSFYDRFQLKSALRSCGKANFVSFDEFAKRTYPHIILVSFLPSLKGYEHYFTNNQRVVEIHNVTRTLSHSVKILNEWTKYTSNRRGRKQMTFQSVKVVLIDARPLHSLTMSEITRTLEPIVREQFDKFGTATVVLDNWRDIGLHSQYFYSIHGLNNMGCKDIFTIKHSESIIQTARNFSASLNLTRPIVGVHIRGERLLIDSKDSPSYYMHCLRQLKDLLEGGTIPGATKRNIVLFHDLGKYGSISCHHYQGCVAERENFLTQINSFGYQIASFDPTGFRPAYLKSVFVAFVEKEFLSQVDVLVTVGLGNFQQNVVDRFLNRTSDVSGHLYRYCFSPQHRKTQRSHNKIYVGPSV